MDIQHIGPIFELLESFLQYAMSLFDFYEDLSGILFLKYLESP